MIEGTGYAVFHKQTVLMLGSEVYFINLQIFAHGWDGNIFLLFAIAIIWYLALLLKQNVISHEMMKTKTSDVIIVRRVITH